MRLHKITGFAFGPIASGLLGLVAVPAIAWLFSAEDVGRMNVFQTALTFGMFFTMLGLDQAYVREYHEIQDKQKLLLTCIAPGFILLVLLSIPSLFFSSYLADFLYKESNPIFYWMTLLAIFVIFITRFLSLILRMEERGWAYSISQVIPKIIQLLMIGILAMSSITKDFIDLQIMVLVSMLSVLFFYAWNTRRQWAGLTRKRFEGALLKKLMHFGAPLIFADLAFWGLSATSTVALRIWSTLDELALYSVANSFATVAVVFQSIFTVIWAPTVYKWVANGVDMNNVDRVAMQVLAVISIIIAICGCFSWLLDWFLPMQYHLVKYIFLCMLIQPLLYTLSEVTCVGIGIERKTSYTILIAVVAMLTNVALSFFLVPTFGAPGAATANAIGFAVFFFARTEISARVWRNFPRSKIYFFVSFFLLMSIVNNLTGSALANYFYIFWFLVLSATTWYFFPQWQQIYSIFINQSSGMIK